MACFLFQSNFKCFFPTLQTIYDKVKGQADSGPKNDGTLLEKRKELQTEVEKTKRLLADQVS